MFYVGAYTSYKYQNRKMNELDTRIEKGAISFVPSHSSTSTKTLEIKFALSGISFKT